MNFLAHLSLSRGNGHSMTGNLMGDFMKGVHIDALPQAIQNGIANHRAVDKFTDSHPAITALRPLFANRYRRFSGVIIDISFDYFLSKHWQDNHQQPLHEFIPACYSYLRSDRPHMPPTMQNAVDHMIAEDWLSGYRDIEGIGLTLDRVASRIRFKNDFSGSLSEVKQHYDALETAFLTLYPALQQHVQDLQLESQD